MHWSHYLKRFLASQRKRDVGSCTFWAWLLLASLGERDVVKSAIEAQGLLAACWEQAVGKGAVGVLTGCLGSQLDFDPGWVVQSLHIHILFLPFFTPLPNLLIM